jgi:hypothetical protein
MAVENIGSAVGAAPTVPPQGASESAVLQYQQDFSKYMFRLTVLSETIKAETEFKKSAAKNAAA